MKSNLTNKGASHERGKLRKGDKRPRKSNRMEKVLFGKDGAND